MSSKSLNVKTALKVGFGFGVGLAAAFSLIEFITNNIYLFFYS